MHVKRQCSPGRVILPGAHYQINNPLVLCVWPLPKSPSGLLPPLSLSAFQFPCFSCGLPDVPDYMTLSSWVQDTKPRTRKS